MAKKLKEQFETILLFLVPNINITIYPAPGRLYITGVIPFWHRIMCSPVHEGRLLKRIAPEALENEGEDEGTC
jgi:hypothetical protein